MTNEKEAVLQLLEIILEACILSVPQYIGWFDWRKNKGEK
jgi:hypothetical protein